jgi:secreted trypsin-like serine protease
MKKVLIALSFSSLFACAQDTAAPAQSVQPQNNTPAFDSNEDEIIGGVEDRGDPAVVALYAREPDAEGGSLCTATVISSTVVLTAAHCVHPDLVGEKAQFVVLTAWNLLDKENPSPQLEVEATHYDPEFSHKNLMNGHDIAVVILKQPTDLPPIAINRETLKAEWVTKPVRLIGYGLNTHFKREGAGIKRQATVKLKKVEEDFVVTGSFTKGICSGDSGGPILLTVDGVERVIGVNSFGFLFCVSSSRSTRVDQYLKFVDQYL